MLKKISESFEPMPEAIAPLELPAVVRGIENRADEASNRVGEVKRRSLIAESPGQRTHVCAYEDLEGHRSAFAVSRGVRALDCRFYSCGVC